MMTVPAAVLGFLLASIYGTGFHAWRGGGLGRLVLYVILAWIGFWIGHVVGAWLGWTFGQIGVLQLGTATIGSATFLAIGYWLGLVEAE